jgi:AraC-like DNA-binding protein
MTNLQTIDAQSATPVIRRYLPSESVRPLIKAYYFVESPGPLADFTPPEHANIRFAIDGKWLLEDIKGTRTIEPSKASLFGPSDRARRFITDGGLVMGFELTPTGWLTLIGGDASAYANIVFPLGRQLGISGSEIHRQLAAASGDSARVAILDAILSERPAPQRAYCALAERVQNAIRSGTVNHVADLATEIGIDHRRLLRVCSSAFGFPPVRLLRRQRLLRTLDRIRRGCDQPLGRLIDSSYYDQAHFNREFKAYMGMTPRAYLGLVHDAADRAAEAGQAPRGVRFTQPRRSADAIGHAMR